MKIHTYFALVPMAAMVAQAEPTRPDEASSAEMVQEAVELMQSDGVLNMKPLRRWSLSNRLQLNILEHLEMLKQGDEKINDYPWLAVVSELYSSCQGKRKPMPAEVVCKFIKAGADVNSVYKGRTALFNEMTPEAMKALLAAGANVNFRDENDNTPLFFLHGSAEICRMLLEHGADVNARNKRGCTPIYDALDSSSEEAFDVLVAAGADLNVVNEDGDTPLHDAFCCASEVSRLKLIKCGVNLNVRNKAGVSPLDIALANNEVETVLEIMHAGVELDEKAYSPMFYACFFGQLDEVKRLIEEGDEDIDSPIDKSDVTPLAMAILAKREELVALLLELGADPNAEMDDGQTAMHLAACAGNVDIMKRLLAAGADVNARDEDGKTPICYAVEENNEEAVDVLLAAGANLSYKSKSYYSTPLTMAVSAENLSMVRKLIAAGADVNTDSRSNRESALYIAVERGNMEMIEILLAAGADVNISHGTQYTPLHTAVENGKVEAVRRLLEAGAFVNEKNGRIKSRLMLRALEDGTHKEILDMLLAAGARLSKDDMEAFSYFNEALKMGDREMCLFCVDAGFLPDSLDDPLLLAILRNQMDEAKKLLAEGAAVQGQENKVPPLALAIVLKMGDAVDMLLAAGADVNVAHKSSGMTPLMYAAWGGDMAICEKLLAAGADVKALTSAGLNVVGIAASKGYANLCRLLIKAGGDPRLAAQTDDGVTPLHLAASAEKNCVATCAALLEAGVDPNILSAEGNTPLHYMLFAEDERMLSDACCQVLIKAGADAEIKNNDGKSAKDIEGRKNRQRLSGMLTMGLYFKLL